MKDASGKVTQYGASMVHINEEPTYEMLMMWSIAFGGSLTDGTKPTVTDPGVVEALAFMKTLYDEELIPRGRSEDDQRALFAAGTTAMEIDGPWQVPFVGKVNPDIVGSIKASHVPWDGPATGGPNVLLAVGNTDNQELAWKFIETVVSPEVQGQFSKYADTVRAPRARSTTRRSRASRTSRPSSSSSRTTRCATCRRASRTSPPNSSRSCSRR